jgi:hypothetical protein
VSNNFYNALEAMAKREEEYEREIERMMRGGKA